jgi:hypothetical protein
MEEFGKFLGKSVIFILLLIIAFFECLLEVYVILSISKIYHLNFILQYTFVQLFGIMILVSLLKYTFKKSEETDFYESMKKSFTGELTYAIVFLTAWGFAFIGYYFIS